MSNYEIKIDKYGTKSYRLNGKLHREDGPSIEFKSGEKWWHKNGELHREDGPAIEEDDGTKYWYLNGKEYGVNDDFTNESWTRFIKTLIFS